MGSPPRVLVYSSLYPSEAAPNAGIFIRERMTRVAARVPLVVVAPQPWSPFDWVVRLFRPGYRVPAKRFDRDEGLEVHRPRFLSLPGVLKRLDGWLMAVCTWPTVARLHAGFRATVIDAHFGYPDGYAATWIGRRLGLPVAITLRGSKDRLLLGTSRETGLRAALAGADQLIAVTASLAEDVGRPLGHSASRFELVGNGVDLGRFFPEERIIARERLGIDQDAQVLIGVGNLIELKGFQRVIPLLPELRREFPRLLYLIVGGGTSTGDISDTLRALAREHGVEDCVRLCGRQPPDALRWYYSAADVFALATSYEGWANVFLEAMACGLPVVSTRVGGNPEVVREPDTGLLVDYWDHDGFRDALAQALRTQWDRARILRYARDNDWTCRIDQLVRIFERLSATAR